MFASINTEYPIQFLEDIEEKCLAQYTQAPASLKANKIVVQFCHLVNLYIIFKKEKTISAELGKKIRCFFRQLSQKETATTKKLKGALDYCFRCCGTSIIDSWRLHQKPELFYHLKITLDQKASKLASKLTKRQEAIISTLWSNIWLPEGAKNVLFYFLRESLAPYLTTPANRFKILMAFATQSGIGVLCWSREQLLEEELSIEHFKKIACVCARSSGLRLLPYLADFVPFFDKDFIQIITLSLQHAKPEHFYAFHPSEIEFLIDSLPINIEAKEKCKKIIEQKQIDLNITPTHYAENATNYEKKLAKAWIRSYEEPTFSNAQAFSKLIKKIQEEHSEEEGDRIKLAALKKCLHKRPLPTMANVRNFNLLTAGALKEFYRHAFVTFPFLLFKHLTTSPLEGDEKVEIVEEILEKSPNYAYLIVEHFKDLNFKLDDSKAIQLLSHAVDLASRHNIIDLSHLDLDPENSAHKRLIEVAMYQIVSRYRQGAILKTNFLFNYKPLYLIDPALKLYEPLLKLCHLVGINPYTADICALESGILKEEFEDRVKKSIALVAFKSPEIADLLASMWKKRKLKKLLDKLAQLEVENLGYKEACRELHAANTGFEDVITTFLLIDYSPMLSSSEKKERWAALARMVDSLENLQLRSEIIEKFYDAATKLPLHYSLDVSLAIKNPTCPFDHSAYFLQCLLDIGLIHDSQNKDFYNRAQEILFKQMDLFQAAFNRELIAELYKFFVFLSHQHLPPYFENFVFAFLLIKAAEGQTPTETRSNLRRAVSLISILTFKNESDSIELLRHQDIALLEREAVSWLELLFKLPKDKNTALLKILRSWQYPELLVTYYFQWKIHKKILDPFITWFQHVVAGEENHLRYVAGQRHFFFAKFPEALLERFKEEEAFDLTDAKNYWELKRIPLTTKAENIRNILEKQAPGLFKMRFGEHQIVFNELGPMSPWNQWVKEIKGLFRNSPSITKRKLEKIKIMKNLYLLSVSQDDKTIIKTAKRLQNLLKGRQKERVGAALQLINPLIAELNTADKEQNAFEKIECLLTSDAETLFTISDQKVMGSCMSISRPLNEYNQCMPSRLSHGKQKLLLIRDKKTQEPLAVFTVKLLLDVEEIPVILREPVYQCRGCTYTSQQLSDIATMALLFHFKEFDVPIIVGCKEASNLSSPFFNTFKYKNVVTSDPGQNLVEYEDTMCLQCCRLPYRLSEDFLIHHTLKI